MDSWSPQQLAMMQAGGNANLIEFFKSQGFPSDLSPEEKYDAEATKLYRARVKAIAEGKAAPEVPKIGYTAKSKAKPLVTNSLEQGDLIVSPAAGKTRGDLAAEKLSKLSTGKMQGFGSQQPSAPEHDFISDVSGAFFSFAQYTSDAATRGAQQAKVAASALAEKSKTVSGTDITNTVKEASAKGWSAFSSLISSAMSAASDLAASVDPNAPDVPRAFGVSRSSNSALPGLSSAALRSNNGISLESDRARVESKTPQRQQSVPSEPSSRRDEKSSGLEDLLGDSNSWGVTEPQRATVTEPSKPAPDVVNVPKEPTAFTRSSSTSSANAPKPSLTPTVSRTNSSSKPLSTTDFFADFGLSKS